MKLIIEKKTSSKTEQIKLAISLLCLVNGVHLSNTEMEVLAYYVNYKISKKTDELLISSKVVKDISGLRNIKGKLKKLGFLKSTDGLYNSYELSISKTINLEDNQFNILIKIDNS